VSGASSVSGMPVAALFRGMTEKKRCIRCDRPIDAAARICPYCNWDQTNAAVPRPEETAAPVYVPRPERPWRRYALIAAGGLVLVIVAFALGSHVLGTAAAPAAVTTTDQTTKTSTSNAGPVRPAPRPDITLVPSSDTAGQTAPLEAPITSAPAETASTGTPSETQRTDATAVSSVQYAQLAARAQAEKKKSQPLVDPRSLTGPAYQQGQQTRQQQPQQQQPQMSSAAEPVNPPSSEARPAAPAQSNVRTAAEPEYQPIPDVQVNETTTVRLTLSIGADGHVKEVDVGGQGIEGQTAKIIATVQTWRFRPATENGMPVPSTFTTALSFHGNQ